MLYIKMLCNGAYDKEGEVIMSSLPTIIKEGEVVMSSLPTIIKEGEVVMSTQISNINH